MKNDKLRILFLEDVPSEVPVVEHELAKAGLGSQIKRVDTKRAFVEALTTDQPDIILSDHGLPAFDGFAALALAKEHSPTIPFIFVTACAGEEFTIEAFEKGADDYVLKGQPAKLAPAVRRVLRDALPRKLPPVMDEHESSFRLLLESLKDYAILRLDAAGHITYWNEGATELYGYLPDEIVGQNIADLYPQEEETTNRPALALKTAGTKGIFEDEGVRITKDGHPIQVQTVIRPLNVPAHQPPGFALVSHRIGDPVTIERSMPTTDERYRELVELCPCALFVIGNSGEILYSNATALKLLGAKTPGDLLACTFQQILPPRSGRKIFERIRRARTEVTGFVEHELRRLDGTRVSVDISATPVCYLGRTNIEIVAHDISKRKRAERAQREETRHIRAILESALDGIISINHQGLVREWNPAAERMFGYKRAEVLDQRIEQLIVPESLRRVYRQGLTDYLRTEACSLVGRPVELTLRRATGEEFQVELSITRNGTDQEPWWTAMVRDITERRQAQSALQRSEEYFRLLVEGAKDYAIYMLDAPGRVAGWNAGAERLEGYQAKEVFGKHFSIFFPPEEVKASVPAGILQRAKADGRVWNEGWRMRKDGSRFWSLGVVTALRDEAGNLQGYSKIVHDRSRQKQYEEEILRLNATLEECVAERTAQLEDANEELEAFSYSVSHDLRSPLRHITGYIEILQAEAADLLSESSRRHLETIRNSAQRMSELIDALLGFSRMGRAELRQRSVPLRSLVEQAQHELAEEIKGRNIEWLIKPLPTVQGDAFLLRQAVVNLLSNALKFTRQRAVARIEIGTRTTADEIIFFVRDNGAGFDMRYADKLFGVFQRLHREEEFEGTGIGLANVRRVIHRHGGRTWAEGRLNQDATFYFSLPKPKKGAT